MLTPEVVKTVAAYMLAELASQKLTVCVLPDGRGSSRGVRCVIVSNPDWYSRLCQQYVSKRRTRYTRPRTFIKRIRTLEALNTISTAGLNSRFVYHERLADAIAWFVETRGVPQPIEQQTNQPLGLNGEGF